MRISLLNSVVDSLSFENAVEAIMNCAKAKRKVNVFFLNALKVYEVDHSAKLKYAFESAEFILADGVPIVWASKLLGKPIPGRVNGTDLFERLLKESETTGKGIFFLGATDENLAKMIENIRSKHPRLRISGFRNGYFNDQDDNEVIEHLNASGADILFLGFSSPKKEIWAYNNRERIEIPVIQGVGGSFDVLAGVTSRAPVWMQKNGLEWFYRFLVEPRRMFRRYLITNGYFLYILAKTLLKTVLVRQIK